MTQCHIPGQSKAWSFTILITKSSTLSSMQWEVEHCPNIRWQAPCQHHDQTRNIPRRCSVTTALLCSHQPTELHPQRCQARIYTKTWQQNQSSTLCGWSETIRQEWKRPDSPDWDSSNLYNRYLHGVQTRKMCKANHPTWKHQDNRQIKSRHRKNQRRRHWNRLQISGHTTKHAEQTKRGQTQSNNNLQKKVRADSQITPQGQKQNTGHQHIRNASDHLHSRNHRLEQERNTGSRQNGKEDNEHVQMTSARSRHSHVVPCKKRRRQRIEKGCSYSQIPMCRITGVHQQNKGKRSSDRSSLETSSNQRVEK